MPNPLYWIYILHCNNDTYYTGYTNDIFKRYQAHLDRRAKCKYTQSFTPLCVAQCWKINSERSFAMAIERSIKKLTRGGKEALILHPESLIQDERVLVLEQNILNELNVLSSRKST